MGARAAGVGLDRVEQVARALCRRRSRGWCAPRSASRRGARRCARAQASSPSSSRSMSWGMAKASASSRSMSGRRLRGSGPSARRLPAVPAVHPGVRRAGACRASAVCFVRIRSPARPRSRRLLRSRLDGARQGAGPTISGAAVAICICKSAIVRMSPWASLSAMTRASASTGARSDSSSSTTSYWPAPRADDAAATCS
jgi:hypothetical protein